jgi:flagellar basal-body rod protein FlgG
MLRSLYTAASGMVANQLMVDNISNNLANSNTTGYKKSRVAFQDLLYQTMVEPGSTNSDGTRLPGSLQVGLGIKTVGNTHDFAVGTPTTTNGAWDVAITGDGFFQVQLPDQTTGYTRDGSFKVNADGILVTADGYTLEPQIQVPANSTNPVVGADGKVTVQLQGQTTQTEIGQIQTAVFTDPGGLLAKGQNLFTETAASGAPVVSNPGQNSSSALQPQSLEGSNVQMVEEMVNLIIAQRAYEMSSKAITTSDQMLQTANNLHS